MKRFYMYRQEWECCNNASEGDTIYRDCPFCERKKLLEERRHVDPAPVLDANVHAANVSNAGDVPGDA